jgi:hypothetical protein
LTVIAGGFIVNLIENAVMRLLERITPLSVNFTLPARFEQVSLEGE